MEFRLMTIDDYDEVYDIWVACHNGLNSTDDSKEGIEKYLKRNPTTSFVAVDDGHVAGVILCGHDGRRGYIQHMSVSPDHRRLGIGGKLVELALEALNKEGIKLLNRTTLVTRSGKLRASLCAKISITETKRWSIWKSLTHTSSKNKAAYRNPGKPLFTELTTIRTFPLPSDWVHTRKEDHRQVRSVLHS